MHRREQFQVAVVCIVCAVLFVLTLGMVAANAASHAPPPPTSVQEPTDWTQIVVNVDDPSGVWVRELVINGRHCIVANGHQRYSDKQYNPAISCDWSSK